MTQLTLLTLWVGGEVSAGSGAQQPPYPDRAIGVTQLTLLTLWRSLGGPVAELAKLIGEVVSVERVPITFAVNEGRGTLQIAGATAAELEPYRGPNGAVTTLTVTIFSTVPGAPVCVGKATRYQSKISKLERDV